MIADGVLQFTDGIASSDGVFSLYITGVKRHGNSARTIVGQAVRVCRIEVNFTAVRFAARKLNAYAGGSRCAAGNRHNAFGSIEFAVEWG